MMPISLGGLIGAIAGTIVAGIAYHLLIDRLERSLSRDPSQEIAPGEGQEQMQAVIRRIALAVDLLAFAALGYWLGDQLGD